MRLKRILLQPIRCQWPILLAWIVLVGWSSLLQNPFYRWFVIFLHAWLVAALVHRSRRAWVKVLFYVLAFAFFLIEATLESCYGLAISPTTLTLLAETTPQETQEFLGTVIRKPGWWITLALGILFALTAWQAERFHAARLKRRSEPWKSGIATAVIALVLIVGLVGSWCYVRLFQCKTTDEVSAWNLHMRYPADALTRTVVSLFDVRLSASEMSRAISHADVSPLPPPKEPVQVILVIGESFIKQHSPLYGYGLNTTPRLSEEQRQGRLFVFTDAVSPYNLTTQVVRNVISCNSMSDGESWSAFPPLTAVFKAGGCRVSMYDNQKTFSQAATFTFALNTYLYHPQMSSRCYDETNGSTFPFDGQLIEAFNAAHPLASADTTRSQLTIFHLMGQHARAEQRYPADDARFAHFTPDSIRRNEPWMNRRKKAEIAHYDNATLYNDYVLSLILDRYAAQNAVMIYLSDHGEEVFDYRDNIGRATAEDMAKMLQHQYAVPCMVWCSDTYRRRHPETVGQLNQALQRPFTIDNVCQLLFHLADMTDHAYYRSRHDVLSQNYVCGQRMVNDRWDYDEIVNGTVH